MLRCSLFILVLASVACGDQVVVRESPSTCGNGQIEPVKLVMMATLFLLMIVLQIARSPVVAIR